MKKILLVVIILAMSYFLLAQNPSVYNLKTVPEYKFRTLYIQGDNLLDWYKFGDAGHMNINFGGVFGAYCQRTDMTMYYGDILGFSMLQDEGDNNGDSWTVMDNNLYVGAAKYFGLPQVYGDMNFYFDSDNYGDPDKTSGMAIELNIGAGVGRVFSATRVAQATAILDVLGGDLSNEKILELADIIGKRDYYVAVYKDCWAGKYYEAIANAAGFPNKGLSVLKILTNPIYTISTRQVGWQVLAGYHNWFLAAEDDPFYSMYYEAKGDIVVHGDFAKPIGLDKQFTAYVEYAKSLEEDAGADLNAGFDFTIDHEYTWSSFFGFDYESYLPEEGDGDNTMYLELGTRKNIMDKLTATASFMYEKYSEDDDAELWFNIFFKYF